MSIYSLNQFQDFPTTTADGTIDGNTVTFDGLVLPQDNNAGPLAVFVIACSNISNTDFINAVTVNGAVPDVLFTGITLFNSAFTVVAIKLAATAFDVEVTLDGPCSNAKLYGYAFGNVDQIFGVNSDSADSADPAGGVLGIAGTSAAQANALIFSAAAVTNWYSSTDTTLELSIPTASVSTYYPDEFPTDALQITDYVIARTGYLIGTMENFSAANWTFDNPDSAADDYAVVGAVFGATALADESTSFNCECDEDQGQSTLAQLRRRMLVRLGYAAQADNPPPGMADLLDDFLYSSQYTLYNKYNALRTERFYHWDMEATVRFYDLDGNEETCQKRMNAYKISWVGCEDLNGAWLPMHKGIPPEFYTAVSYNGIPSRYEIRQCIEIFPAPSAAYTLWIKGHFGLEPFDEDEDKTTIDSELVFLWALAIAKKHYGQADADATAGMANTLLGDLVAGSHQTARYIPGSKPMIPASPPVFLPLV